jgi:hypothetical protein
MRRRWVQPVKEGDTRPRCMVSVRRRVSVSGKSARLVPCGRLAQLCEIRADRFRFRVQMDLCARHRAALAKWKPDIRVFFKGRRSVESEIV